MGQQTGLRISLVATPARTTTTLTTMVTASRPNYKAIKGNKKNFAISNYNALIKL